MLTLAASLFVCAGLFGCDDDGFAILLVDGDLPAAAESAAKLAADSCPEFAITVE